MRKQLAYVESFLYECFETNKRLPMFKLEANCIVAMLLAFQKSMEIVVWKGVVKNAFSCDLKHIQVTAAEIPHSSLYTTPTLPTKAKHIITTHHLLIQNKMFICKRP